MSESVAKDEVAHHEALGVGRKPGVGDVSLEHRLVGGQGGAKWSMPAMPRKPDASALRARSTS